MDRQTTVVAMVCGSLLWGGATGALGQAAARKGQAKAAGPYASELANPFHQATFLRDWVRTSNLAEIRKGVLYLDGVLAPRPVAVFERHKAFVSTQAAADFRVARLGRKARCFRLIFGSTDSLTYHAVEVERTKVSLIRVAPGEPAKTLDSRGIRDSEGQWHVVKADCLAGLIRVYYEGRLQFAVRGPKLPAGKIGVWTRGARVEVRGLTFGGQPARMSEVWRLRAPDPAPKGKPKDPPQKPQATRPTGRAPKAGAEAPQ